MSEYLIIRAGTLDILGASWSTDLATMERLAPKLGGIVTTAAFLRVKGLEIILEKLRKDEEPRPRKLYIGSGANKIALSEEGRAPYGGAEKSDEVIFSQLTVSNKRGSKKEAA